MSTTTSSGDLQAESTNIIEPIQPADPLRKQVYERLESLIVYGEIRSGERLSESALARQLGVSRIPVREALQLLHRDGWIDMQPRQSAVVHTPTLQEVDDVFGARELVETEVARLAATNATTDDVAMLRSLLQDGSRTIAGGDERAMVGANESFHHGLTVVAGNRVLTEVVALLGKRIAWYFATVVTTRSPRSWQEHSEIVDAVEAHDPSWAADAMRRHLARTAAAYHDVRARTAIDGDDREPEGTMT